VPFDYEPPEVPELDLAAEGISTVIWTSGYRLRLDRLADPDAQGAPRHVRGMTEISGLTFIGLLWQLHQGSATLFGVGPDALYPAERMSDRQDVTSRASS
jgi:putative flavoprotein involved in K+ transport